MDGGCPLCWLVKTFRGDWIILPVDFTSPWATPYPLMYC
jgi:hypothetical protein